MKFPIGVDGVGANHEVFLLKYQVLEHSVGAFVSFFYKWRTLLVFTAKKRARFSINAAFSVAVNGRKYRVMLVAIFSSVFMLLVAVNWGYKANFYIRKKCQPQQILSGAKTYGLKSFIRSQAESKRRSD